MRAPSWDRHGGVLGWLVQPRETPRQEKRVAATPHSLGHWCLWNRRVMGVCQAASSVGTAGPSPSRTQPPGPEDTFPHLDFSPVTSLLLTQLHKPREKHTVSHCKPLGDGSRWRPWGREEARLRLAKQKAESGKGNVFVFKLRGMLNAWELILKETQTFLLPADLGL